MNKALKPPGRRPPSPSQVRIDRIGADGDGVSSLPDATPIYVPFTLPGEWVTAEPRRPRGEGWLAHPAAIDQASAARTEPPCAYFGRCGGCALQHWRDQDYVEWKRGLLIAALRRGGFACAESLPLIRSRPHERRRLDFAVRRDPGQILLGLHRTGSAEVIDLTHCTVLHPVLTGLLAPLRTLLQAMQGVRRQASVVINLLSAGPDVLLRTDAELSLADRNGLIGFARAHAVPRVSWTLGQTQPEAICAFRPAVTMLSGIEVRPPPGVFLQTTAEAEQAIIHAVLSGLPARMTGRSRIVELFAGCGTLTFALAKRARVAAWEGDGASVAARKEAVNRAGSTQRSAIWRVSRSR